MNPSYIELAPAEPDRLPPDEVVRACLEHGCGALLVNDGAFPPSFFDLSTGVAGALVQQLVNYGLRMAVVVPDPAVHSAAFQDFAREAARSAHFRFFRTRAEAMEWLLSAQ